MHPAPGVRRSASVALALVALVLTACTSAPGSPGSTRAPEPSAPPAASAPATTPVAEPIARGLPPQRVHIPALALDMPLIDLGIAPSGQMEAPRDYDEVGWFTGGGRPGGYGPTVIAGHVDSPTGAAVFFRLKELTAGDVVEVTDAEGTSFRYTVTTVADYPKSAFPTAEVFGAVVADELRLITCGGVFDTAAASYTENRVVYAVRAPV